MNIKVKAIEPYKLIVDIEGVNGIVEFDQEFLNRGPFFQPLLDFEFFKQVYVNLEDGLFEWPNTFGISISEVEFGLKNSKNKSILIY